jgi:hypothetical protein
MVVEMAAAQGVPRKYRDNPVTVGKNRGVDGHVREKAVPTSVLPIYRRTAGNPFSFLDKASLQKDYTRPVFANS